MDSKKTPLQLEGIYENIYAGFWVRLGSLFLDFIIIIPVVVLVLYLNSLDKNIYFITVIPNLIFGAWYNIYLPKKYGGTPGKLISGIKIIRLDGESIDWKEAILRYIILFCLGLLACFMMINSILQADEETYKSLSWLQQSQYIMSLSPVFFSIYYWASNIWIYSEFIVLLTNKRKRAIHDYIAGTVIIRSKYHDAIKNAMSPGENNLESPTNETIQ